MRMFIAAALIALSACAPEAPQQPEKPVTAICEDGTESFSKHASGTCSYHGGVREWINHPNG